MSGCTLCKINITFTCPVTSVTFNACISWERLTVGKHQTRFVFFIESKEFTSNVFSAFVQTHLCIVGLVSEVEKPAVQAFAIFETLRHVCAWLRHNSYFLRKKNGNIFRTYTWPFSRVTICTSISWKSDTVRKGQTRVVLFVKGEKIAVDTLLTRFQAGLAVFNVVPYIQDQTVCTLTLFKAFRCTLAYSRNRNLFDRKLFWN